MHYTLHKTTVHLDQHEVGGIAHLLDYVQAGHARFLYAVAGILQRCLVKGVDKFWFDVYVHVDDKQGVVFLSFIRSWVEGSEDSRLTTLLIRFIITCQARQPVRHAGVGQAIAPGQVWL
jgi:hypothetical protein